MAKPPLPQPTESELSWLANPVVWVAIALIVLAVASIILLPLLRRPARSAAPAAESPVAPESLSITPNVESTATRMVTREPRSVRPTPVLAAAAPTQPKPIEMLRNIDLEGDHEVDAPITARSRPLPDTEPPTASIIRRTEEDFLAEPATGSPPLGTPLELTKTKMPTPAEAASELRLDEGLDFNLGDLSFETKTRPSTTDELPALELKPVQAVSSASSTQRLSESELPSLELHSIASPKPTVASSEPKLPAAPAAASLKFEFNDVSQDHVATGGGEVLRLDEDLKTLGLDTLNLGTMDASSLDSGGGLGGLNAGGVSSSEAATDYVETKLDLASAYLDMGDQVGARSLLEDVIREGDTSQKQRANALLKKLG